MIHPTLEQSVSTVLHVPEKTGDVGVELEVEGLLLPRQCVGWSIKREHSLRGKGGRVVSQDDDQSEDIPWEYTSRNPWTLEKLGTRLTELEKLFSSSQTQVSLTHRASTHIHVNMSRETMATVFMYILIFTSIEPVLLRLCGPLRNGNLFCLPAYETGDLPHHIEKLVSALINFSNPRDYWSERGKYSALNIDPLRSLGSVEVRCFPNSVTPAEIVKWATWLVRIRELARASGIKFFSFVDHLFDDPQWVLTNVFGNEPLFGPCYPNTPTDLVLFGAEHAYEIARSMRPLLEYVDKPKKKPEKKSLEYTAFDDFMPPPMTAGYYENQDEMPELE